MNAVQGTPEQEKAMGEQALSLVVKCLSFDFIGTNPDDSSEDVNTIQVRLSRGAASLGAPRANFERANPPS